jgi:hypothetical protein
MKILFKDNKYTKVSSDLEADEKVKKFGYRYASRSEWKTNVRDAAKIVKEAIEVEKVSKKLEKSQTSKERKAQNRAKAYAERQER